MPAIQAMRSDALALRAKEDVQEKIPSFFNSVNQSLGQAIVTGQDAAEQLLESRFSAANGVIAQVRQKVSGQGGIAELTAGAGLKIISSALNIILMVFSKTTTTDIIQIASDIANFMLERKTLQLSWDAAAATYAQWVVQAGYAGQDGGTFFKNSAPPIQRAMGGRGALKYRDAFTPRFTDRRHYAGSSLGGVDNYDSYYAWGSVGSISRIGREP